MDMQLITIILDLINFALIAGLFIGRNWIKAKIENSVRHDFDKKIEFFRAEFRKSEEEFKSELRKKETEISTLRDFVFSGRSNRQAILNKRQIEAVENIWNSLIKLAPYEAISSMMSRVNLDFAAKEAPHDPKVQQFFKTIGGVAPMPNAPDNSADSEQPFVSVLVWAYFSAYRSAVIHAFTAAKMLELGVNNVDTLLNHDHVQNLLKMALPHQTEYIEKYRSAGYHHLLDELKQSLLNELRKMLEGAEADKSSIEQASKIMGLVKRVEEDTRSTSMDATP